MMKEPDNSELVHRLTRYAEKVIQDCHKQYPVTEVLFPSPWLIGQEEAIHGMSTAPLEELAKVCEACYRIVKSIRDEGGGFFEGPPYPYHWIDLLNFLIQPDDGVFEKERHNFGFYAGYLLLAELAKYPILFEFQKLMGLSDVGVDRFILWYADKIEVDSETYQEILKAKDRLTNYAKNTCLAREVQENNLTDEAIFSLVGEIIMNSKFSGDLLSDLVLVIKGGTDLKYLPNKVADKVKGRIRTETRRFEILTDTKRVKEKTAEEECSWDTHPAGHRTTKYPLNSSLRDIRDERNILDELEVIKLIDTVVKEPELREIAYLHVLQCLPVSDIARETNKSYTTVDYAIKRILEKLKIIS